jgi:hypothetical protein
MCRYPARVAILRETDPNIGCLAVPISAVGGFIVLAFLAAAAGAGAALSTIIGLGGLGAGAVAAWILLLPK